MKRKYLKPITMVCVLLLMAIYFATVALSVDHPGIELNLPKIFEEIFVNIAVSTVFALSVIWFYDRLGEKYRRLKLIPAAAALIYSYIYRSNGRIFPGDEHEWGKVFDGIVNLGLWISLGLLLTSIIAAVNCHSCSNKLKLALQSVAAFFIAVCILQSSIFYLITWEICSLVLPFIFLLMANIMNKAVEKNNKFALFEIPVYFILAAMPVLPMTDYYPIFNLFIIAFLVAVTVAAIWNTKSESFGKWFFKIKGRKFYSQPCLWTAIIAIGYFLSNYRAILYGLTAPGKFFAEGIESVYGDGLFRLPLYNNFLWIDHVYGFLAAAGVIALIALTLLLLYKCSRGSRLKRYLFTALAVRTVLGFIAAGTTTVWTSLNPLMLGSMYDIAYVLGILLPGDDKT